MFPNIILSVLIIHNGRYYRRQNSNDHEKLRKNPLREKTTKCSYDDSNTNTEHSKTTLDENWVVYHI